MNIKQKFLSIFNGLVGSKKETSEGIRSKQQEEDFVEKKREKVIRKYKRVAKYKKTNL